MQGTEQHSLEGGAQRHRGCRHGTRCQHLGAKEPAAVGTRTCNNSAARKGCSWLAMVPRSTRHRDCTSSTVAERYAAGWASLVEGGEEATGSKDLETCSFSGGKQPTSLPLWSGTSKQTILLHLSPKCWPLAAPVQPPALSRIIPSTRPRQLQLWQATCCRAKL